ncbi:MAG TPA: response regulator transcription factor [Thermoleophilaceae bacterium]|nr:response regulator transcription factor [Thermoleophilaceae bacterium]
MSGGLPPVITPAGTSGDSPTRTVRHLRVLVCDPYPIVREGVAHILEADGFEVVATADDAPELLRKARGHHPDVVVMGLSATADAEEVVRAVEAVRREIGAAVLVLARQIDVESARNLLNGGVGGVGYLQTEHVRDLSNLTEAVRRVAEGGSALDPDVVEGLVARAREDDAISRLTPTERRVLALMAEGESNRGIADELVVTVAAVERHVSSIFHKLELPRTPDRHRRVLAVLRYLDEVSAPSVSAGA